VLLARVVRKEPGLGVGDSHSREWGGPPERLLGSVFQPNDALWQSKKKTLWRASQAANEGSLPFTRSSQSSRRANQARGQASRTGAAHLAERAVADQYSYWQRTHEPGDHCHRQCEQCRTAQQTDVEDSDGQQEAEDHQSGIEQSSAGFSHGREPSLSM
jgi:hypothetical protein